MHNFKLIQQWLDSSKVSNEEKQQIHNLTNEEKEKYFSCSKWKFGTAGIRALVGPGTKRLNIHTYSALFYAFALWVKKTHPNVKEPKILLFHDTRLDLNDNKYAEAITKVLTKQGLKVYLIENNDPAPTPLLSFLVRKYSFDGAVNITASHNPKEWNGFKVYDNTGTQISNEHATIFSEGILNADQIFDIESDEEFKANYLSKAVYQEFFAELIKNLPKNNISIEKRNYPVLFSGHHGVTVGWMKKLVNQLGYSQFYEYEPESNLTSNFPDKEILNPEDPSSFININKLAEEKNIGYTFAADPDGDRFAFCEQQKDKTWYSFNGNEQGILLLNYLLTISPEKYKNSFMVSTYVTGNFIEKIIPVGASVYRTGTGFKNICAQVDKIFKAEPNKKLLIAYEEAIGAMFFPYLREKCSFQCIALSLEMITYYKEQNKLMTEVLKDLYELHGYWLGKTDSFVLPLDGWDVKIAELLDQAKNHRLLELFGFAIKEISYNKINNSYDWILNNNSWVRFRASGTEPKFKIYYNFYGSTSSEVEISYKNFREYFIDYFDLKKV